MVVVNIVRSGASMITISTSERIVLSALATQSSGITEEHLQAITNLPLQTVRECLVTLVKHGFVQPIEPHLPQ